MSGGGTPPPVAKRASSTRPGVILDRDGTLIDFHRDVELGVVTPAFHPNQLRLLPGVLPGLHRLQDAGFVLAMATNQPDAAKGRLPVSAISRTNRHLIQLLADAGIHIAAWRACTHHPEGASGGDSTLIRSCTCRKPAPGMLLSLVAELQLDATRSWMVGDTATDAGAAAAAGVNMALLQRHARCELCPFVGATPQGVTATLFGESLDQLAPQMIAATAHL